MLKTNKNIFKICLVIAIIISSILLFTGCGNKVSNKEEDMSYQQPIKDYFEGVKNRDISQVLKAFPEFMEMGSTITADDINYLYAQYETLYGANINIEYSMGNATSLGEDKLKEIEEEITELYEKEIDITAGYKVPVTLTVHGDGLQTETENEQQSDENKDNKNNNVEQDDMYVLQYNGNWYIM